MTSFWEEARKKQHPDQSTLTLETLIGAKEHELTSTETVETPLSIATDQTFSKEDQYALSFALLESPPLKKGELAISGVSAFLTNSGSLEVTALIRNGLDESVRFAKVQMAFFTKAQLIATGAFDLTALGHIPARQARPWTFVFERDQLTERPESIIDWTLAFDLTQKREYHFLSIKGDWNATYTAEEQAEIVKQALAKPAPPEGRVAIQVISTTRLKTKLTKTTLLIQNNHSQTLRLKNVPFELRGKHQTVLEQISYDLALEIPPHTSKLVTVLLPFKQDGSKVEVRT
ncbi:hypothetical protein JCM9140_3599 [Halalkalibacter wakoensis JCM 9140]|uniref:SLAP domain-containing protein n=1 Tax=Halalkalibacter wakoensis JCM 9140 TaxID=1236970 RepID=W4Q645_9BACI|nr:SLAP domain-containing protein [Halalkalibacter wakoensis]GAE27452.1 hypothetical protein JCM9140_3599 [Halalkalibacter wakoensis JCM 9140]